MRDVEFDFRRRIPETGRLHVLCEKQPCSCLILGDRQEIAHPRGHRRIRHLQGARLAFDWRSRVPNHAEESHSCYRHDSSFSVIITTRLIIQTTVDSITGCLIIQTTVNIHKKTLVKVYGLESSCL